MAAYWKTFRHWQTWAGLVGAGLCSFIGDMLGGLIGHASIGSAIGAAVGGFLYAQVATTQARPYLRAILSEKELH